MGLLPFMPVPPRQDTFVRFGERDRIGALKYSMRMSNHENRPYVLFFEYHSDNWCSMSYEEYRDSFVARGYLACTEDIRFIMPNGEITKW